jgi:hypothetical protein
MSRFAVIDMNSRHVRAIKKSAADLFNEEIAKRSDALGFFGLTEPEKAHLRKATGGNPDLLSGALDDLMLDRSIAIPANDPALAASAASSNGGGQPIPVTTAAVWPADMTVSLVRDVLDVPSDGAASNMRNNLSGTEGIVAFQLTPTASAGAQVQLDCVAVGSALASQGYSCPVGVLKAAVIAAISAKRAA